MRIDSNHIKTLCASCLLACWMASCAPLTNGVPEGDKLYVGIDHINYFNYDDNDNDDHFLTTKEEVDAALALPPTALFSAVRKSGLRSSHD